MKVNFSLLHTPLLARWYHIARKKQNVPVDTTIHRVNNLELTLLFSLGAKREALKNILTVLDLAPLTCGILFRLHVF